MEAQVEMFSIHRRTSGVLFTPQDTEMHFRAAYSQKISSAIRGSGAAYCDTKVNVTMKSTLEYIEKLLIITWQSSFFNMDWRK